MRLALLLAFTVSVLSCLPNKDTPLFCDEATPCTAPEPPFCDINGVYNPTNHTCIDTPAGVCSSDTDCTDSATPICGETMRQDAVGESFSVSECRACSDGATGDAECATKDAALPLCASDSCVDCRESMDCMNPDLPVCDTAANTCVGCTQGSDCASDVCELDSGECVDAANIVYVSTGGTDGPACGTQASRCATIGGGQGGLSKVTATRKTLKLASGTYPESVTISGLEVELLGPATVDPPGNNTPVFDISGGSDVGFTEITATGATTGTDADGVVCGGASTFRMTDSTITQNADVGLQADGCTLELSRSTISQNAQGGVDITGSSFDIQNNFIVSNGTFGAAGSLIGGVQVGATQASDAFSFNTVADNSAANGAAASGLDCELASQMVASGNIVYLSSGTPLRANCNLTYSNIEGGAPGTGNIDMLPDFVNEAQRNFHLEPSSPGVNVADPAATLAIDFDGDARPQDARHDMGADEVSP